MDIFNLYEYLALNYRGYVKLTQLELWFCILIVLISKKT